MDENKVVDEFGKEFKTDELADPFGETQKPEEAKEPVADDEPRKNRHHRRLEQKLQAEREANIQLAERLRVLNETQKFKQETGLTESDDISRIYGTETPEAREATRILQNALKKMADDAKAEALKVFEEQQSQSSKAQVEAETTIDTELEALEDEYDIDLTSNSASAAKARSELLDLVEELSPKDRQGNIIEYANFDAAFRLYQAQTKKDSTRQREVGARSMVRSGTSSQTVGQSAAEQWLKDAGII